MDFEVYERRSRPPGDDPIIGIQSRGTFSLNAAAFELIKKHRPDDGETWVELLFDAATKTIGFRAVEPERANSYPVRKQQNSESYLCTGVGFLNYHGIEYGEVRHFDAKEYGNGIVGFSVAEENGDE